MRLNSSCSLAVVLFLVSQSSASAVSITQQAYLKASNTGLDFFGQAVAVSGNTVVIGAPYEASANRNPDDNTAFGAGAAYVFVHDAAGVWTQQAYLKAAHPDPNDQFGFSVAISGDTIVVGANHEASSATGVDGDSTDNSAPGAGAAYVFVREGASWSQQAYLKASNTNTGDRFGASVAISGDTIVVGANSEASNTTGVNGDQLDNSASFSGAAYVFVRSAGLWSQQAYLKASNTNSGDDFGLAVAVSGDTIVVGADTEASNATGVNGDQLNNGAAAAGAAYVFVRSGAAWSQQAYLKASNAEMNDIFGTAVAVSGDTVVVGAPGEASNAKGVNGDQTNNGAPLSGAAYVFVRDGTTWSQQAYLKASNTGANDNLGQSLAISGDTIIVGAYKESSNATGVNGDQTNNMAGASGAAYFFSRSGATWGQQAYLKASNTDTNDDFGYAVAVTDGIIVCGAYGEASLATGVNSDQADNSAPNAGAAYIFMTDTDGDGVLDALDGCPDDPAKSAAGQCGCGNADTDSDGDGTADCVDGCPSDPAKIAPGDCGCGAADTDTDGNSLSDCLDAAAAAQNGASSCGVCGAGASTVMGLTALLMRFARRPRNRARP